MTKARKVYFKNDTEMARLVTRADELSEDLTMTEEPPTEGNLYLVEILPQRVGAYLKFEDDDGRTYYMSMHFLNKWLKDNALCFGKWKWEYLKQGYSYSIGFVEEME